MPTLNRHIEFYVRLSHMGRYNSTNEALERSPRPGKLLTALTNKIAIAPMMDWTDRHDRYFSVA